MRIPVLGMVAAAALHLMMPLARAQSPQPFRIGWLTDLQGPTSYVTGPDSVQAVRMAIDDFGGKVLGRPIELVVGDHQNKPDIGSAVAREWLDTRDVRVIMDVGNSAVAFNVRDLAVQRNRAAIFVAAMSSELTGARCSNDTFHWGFDTYSNSRAVTSAVVKSGARKWFYLTVDYAFGYQLERESQEALKGGGGVSLGSVRAPLGTTDYSSYLLQAQSSGADVLAYANTSTDFLNSMKQSAEFGITAQPVFFVVSLYDVDNLGLAAMRQGEFVDSFYWDLNDQTREWSKRFMQRTGKSQPPVANMANAYSATMHYLKAVKAAGTDDNAAVMAKMHEMPVEDFFTHGAVVRADGRVMRDMYLFQVKSPAESKARWDYMKVVRVIPGTEAFRPMAGSDCKLGS